MLKIKKPLSNSKHARSNSFGEVLRIPFTFTLTEWIKKNGTHWLCSNANYILVWTSTIDYVIPRTFPGDTE